MMVGHRRQNQQQIGVKTVWIISDPYSIRIRKIRCGYPISEYPCGYGYRYGFKF